MKETTMLHRDDGLASTRLPGEQLADLELGVIEPILEFKGRLLDLGCGRGRGAAYFALHGFDPVGVDMYKPSLKQGRELKDNNMAFELISADARRLCFRDQSFDLVVSLASMLSEKRRMWMQREDRRDVIAEAVRVTKVGGTTIVCFVHRYWSLKGFFAFLRHYLVWAADRIAGRKAEVGDYTENIGGTPIKFHAFTIREALALYPRDRVQLTLHRSNKRFFTDWFFVVAKKVG